MHRSLQHLIVVPYCSHYHFVPRAPPPPHPHLPRYLFPVYLSGLTGWARDTPNKREGYRHTDCPCWLSRWLLLTRTKSWSNPLSFSLRRSINKVSLLCSILDYYKICKTWQSLRPLPKLAKKRQRGRRGSRGQWRNKILLTLCLKKPDWKKKMCNLFSRGKQRKKHAIIQD